MLQVHRRACKNNIGEKVVGAGHGTNLPEKRLEERREREYQVNEKDRQE